MQRSLSRSRAGGNIAAVPGDEEVEYRRRVFRTAAKELDKIIQLIDEQKIRALWGSRLGVETGKVK